MAYVVSCYNYFINSLNLFVSGVNVCGLKILLIELQNTVAF